MRAAESGESCKRFKFHSVVSHTDIDQCLCWQNLTYQLLVRQISPTVTLIDNSMVVSSLAAIAKMSQRFHSAVNNSS